MSGRVVFRGSASGGKGGKLRLDLLDFACECLVLGLEPGDLALDFGELGFEASALGIPCFLLGCGFLLCGLRPGLGLGLGGLQGSLRLLLFLLRCTDRGLRLRERCLEGLELTDALRLRSGEGASSGKDEERHQGRMRSVIRDGGGASSAAERGGRQLADAFCTR